MKGPLLSIIALGWLAACGGPKQPEAPAPGHDAAVPEVDDVDPVGDGATAGCTADEAHCCKADGTLVVPGGCQPSYPDNVEPSVERAPDGSCQPVPCTLRCLPETAMIATPAGDRMVSGLVVGDPVWTRDAAGQRVAAPIARIQALPVTEAHSLIEVTLADGRVARASEGHPDGRGATMGALRAGDPLDGSIITAVVRIPYEGARTWDLLPDGPTGTYWADGVPLGSTLAVPAR